MSMVERLVPDRRWELFQQVVPVAPARPQGGGRRRHGDREVLAAIVLVVGTGCPWRQLPSGLGPSGPTAHRRFAEWSEAGVWPRLHRLVLAEAVGPGDPQWSQFVSESLLVRAADRAAPTVVPYTN
jgi:transposase